jgi:hypothetical protein
MGYVFRLALSLTLASIKECAFHDWIASLDRVSGAYPVQYGGRGHAFYRANVRVSSPKDNSKIGAVGKI